MKWSLITLFLAFSVLGAIRTPPGETLTAKQLEYIAYCFGDDFDMVEHIESKKLLTAAFAAAPGLSYRAVLPGADDFNPQCTVVFYRHTAADGFVFKRAEVYRGNSLQVVFLQNRDGQFGISGKLAWEIMDVSLLSHLEVISAPLPQADMLHYAYSMVSSRYQGRPCVKITARLSKNSDDWRAVTRVSSEQMKDRKSEFHRKRAFVREYIIDKESLAIFSRTDYNSGHKRIFQQTLGDVQLETFSDMSIFSTPREIAGKVALRYEFEAELFKATRPTPPSPVFPAVKSLFWRIADYALQYGGYFFAALAIVLLSAALLLKIAGRKHAR